MDATLFTKAGFLRINVTSSLGQIPVKDATVSITYTGEPGRVLEELTTDESGLTDTIELPAPDISYSLDPESEVQPYSEFTITVTASGYETVIVSGSEILAESLSTQPIRMNPLDATEEYEKRVVIPAHTLWGSYPAKIPESEVKPIAETGEIVLSRVVVPEYVIVHDGAPSDRTAQNYWVRYTDYIKNVASSEIYSTWPESTIYANVLAIMSFTLNRVYTEWYRNKGYNFTITSSTAFDQKWMYGRNIFESIDEAVEDVFRNYLSRPNVRQPILTQYCDGKRVQCPQWLRQWESMALGEQGYRAIEIIHAFYGDSMYINSSEEVSGVPASYPGFPLSPGSSGSDVMKIQEQLNRISDNYPLIPKLVPDGIFGPQTQEAVKVFQSVFGLTQDGVVGSRTWYRIQDIYVAVTRIAEGV